MAETNLRPVLARTEVDTRASAGVHSAWLRLMCYCAEMGHGEIEKLKIQDGVPVAAEVISRKVKFSS